MVADQLRGSSSTIGVILLVAVTIITATTLSAFVLGVPGEIGTSAAANFDLEQNGIVSSAESSATVEITYKSGNLDKARGRLTVLVNGKPVETVPGVKFRDSTFSELTAGETAVLVQTTGEGLEGSDTIHVQFVEGDSSIPFGSITLDGTDAGSFTFDYTTCYRCGSGGGNVIVTYHGEPISWDRVTIQSEGAVDGSPGPMLTDGESFKIWQRNGQVDGTVKIYFTDPNGNRVLVSKYETP